MAFRKKKQDPFHEIQTCLQKRDYKGALDWFNTLLQKDRKNTQIRLRFADTLVLAGNKRDAVKQFRIVADELAEKGFMIRAIAINKKILQLDPTQTDVHQKLAEMNEERSTDGASRPALAELLHRPTDPLRRSTPAPSPAPAPTSRPPSPAAPAPPPPSVLPELSLEESMAMEFGDTGEVPLAEEEPVVEAVIPAPPPADSEPATGGFELIDEVALNASLSSSAPVKDAKDESLSFDEEPIEFAESKAEEGEDVEIVTIEAETSSPELELSLDGVEPPASEGAEIVLEVDAVEPVDDAEIVELPAVLADLSEVTGDVVTAESLSRAPDEQGDLGEEDEEEIEIIAFEPESEPAHEGDGVESLMGALGEDIDSLIDSIIDDVGSSASGQEPTREPPPTHIPLFSDLTTQEFIAVAILLVRRVAKIGEVIVREGDPGDSMFIVSTGEVRATLEKNGQQVPVATMKDGDFFGEMAVLSGEPRTATVTAVKATELLELSRENLREICARHPHVEAKIRLLYDERMARSQSQKR
jgi:Cyclic nucleotide-binding domain